MKYLRCPRLLAVIFGFSTSGLIVQADVVIFSDTLSSNAPVSLGEAELDSQSGELAPVEYLTDHDEADQEIAVDQILLQKDGLMIENREARFVSVSPAQNFSAAAGDAFRVRVDISPEPGSVEYSGDRWAHVHIGGNEPNQFVRLAGFGILIRSDASREDGYQVFHDGKYIASGSVTTAASYRFDIVVEGREIAFSINGRLQRPFQDGSATYPIGHFQFGYITLGAHNPIPGKMDARFSNLSLERLEVTEGSLLILSSIDGRVGPSPIAVLPSRSAWR